MTEGESSDTDHTKQLIIEAIREIKGHRIVTIDLTKIENAICDHFIICHGESDTQVGSITESIERNLKNSAKIRAHHVEGLQNSQWVLMDFFDILVHIFLEEQRTFFNLEELWADGEVERLEDE